MIYPDYDRSILSTTASILKYFGAGSVYPTLPEVDNALGTNPKHVALIITDGAGVRPLEGALPADSYMRSHMSARVTSIFPSTTTAACTSYYNGQSAYEHGWLGWYLYFKEYAADVTTFMRTTYYTHKPIDGPQAAPEILPFETIFDKIRAAGTDVTMRTQSAFDSYSYHGAHEHKLVSSFAEICENQVRISRSQGRTLTVSYWGEPDTAMHGFGVGSKQAIDHFRLIDNELKSMSRRLSDTLVIVTADHGHINSESIFINEIPEIMDCLVMPPMVEARAAAFYVKPHRRAAFEHIFKEKLGKWFILLSREDVYRTGIFGRGKANKKFDDLIGDYIACAISDKDISYKLPNVEWSGLIGKHAGLTEDEMLVPVIIDRR